MQIIRLPPGNMSYIIQIRNTFICPKIYLDHELQCEWIIQIIHIICPRYCSELLCLLVSSRFGRQVCSRLVKEAVEAGASFLALPECFNFIGVSLRGL